MSGRNSNDVGDLSSLSSSDLSVVVDEPQQFTSEQRQPERVPTHRSSISRQITNPQLIRSTATDITNYGPILGLEEPHFGDHDYFGTYDITKALSKKLLGDIESGKNQSMRSRRLTVRSYVGGRKLSNISGEDTTNEENPEAYFPDLNDATGSVSSVIDAPPDDLPSLRRRRSTFASTIQKFSNKFGYFDDGFKEERLNIIITYLKNYCFLLLGFALALLIYWGSFFGRTARFATLKYAVIVADAQVGDLEPIVGPTVVSFFEKVQGKLGHFEFINSTTINEMAAQRNNTLDAEVNRIIHHQKYWAAYYVKENATFNYVQALQQASTTFSPGASVVDLVYETGSNFNGLNNYIFQILGLTAQAFFAFVPASPLMENLLKHVTDEQKERIVTNAPQLLTTLLTFRWQDNRPVDDQIFTGAFTVATIYLVVFAFFQFVLLKDAYALIAQKLTGAKYLFVRLIVTQFSYLVMGLSLVTLNTAFQIPFNNTFGHLGFLVIWMFLYLTISSLGSIVEALVIVCVAYKPQMIGFVLLGVSSVNLGPVIAPIALCPKFYRYGYAMPIYQMYDLLHVAYFDSWKGRVGVNIGVLCSWIVVANIVAPILMKRMAKILAEKAEKAKEIDGEIEVMEDAKEDKKLEEKAEQIIEQEKQILEAENKEGHQ